MTNWTEVTIGIVTLTLAGFVGYMIAKTSESHQQVVLQQKVDSLNTKLEIQETENKTFRENIDSIVRVSLATAQKASTKIDTSWNTIIKEVADSALKRQISELRDDYNKQITSLMVVIKSDSLIIQRQDSVIDSQDLLIHNTNDENARLQVAINELNAQKSSALTWKLLSLGEAALVTIVAIKK